MTTRCDLVVPSIATFAILCFDIVAVESGTYTVHDVLSRSQAAAGIDSTSYSAESRLDPRAVLLHTFPLVVVHRNSAFLFGLQFTKKVDF